MKHRYLTKSRFKLARQCHTKLYYDGKADFANQKIEDTFLLALADGGFQVGELAKCYFPGGYFVDATDYELSLQQTNDLLKKDNVIIFEAAVRFEDLFIRTDILIKKNGHLELVEVKAKSFDEATEEAFLTQKGTIASGWREYLEDVAFQKYVVNNAFPGQTVTTFLMMADKTAICPTDGLNQKLRIVKSSNGRKVVQVSSALTADDLAVPILRRVQVDSCCMQILENTYSLGSETLNFADYVRRLSEYYARDEKIPSTVSATCAACEFRTTEAEQAAGLRSGFKECWKSSLGWTEKDFAEATVLDIWNFRKKEALIEEGRIKLSELEETDVSPKSDGKPGISASQRQWLQVQKAKENDKNHWIEAGELACEMDRWGYPLHFIDFETSMVAIPFNRGRRPYEGIAFQFSHHIVDADGRIEHRGEYLNTTPGMFPNYDFVRALKSELDQDQGSIFRYAAHENTYLNMIYRQLREDTGDIPDREELCSFIQSITKSVGSSSEKWEGPRSMVDMLELVKRHYYAPAMKGSNSIKKVLPAILNRSRFLQDKYSQPIYGAAGGIPSLNYTDWQWIVLEDEKVIDPYKLLPKMFQDIGDKDFALLSEDDELRDGGAALTAYARLQFEEMKEYERAEIRKALLKYCELDTLAMVMIYEGWKDLISQ